MSTIIDRFRRTLSSIFYNAEAPEQQTSYSTSPVDEKPEFDGMENTETINGSIHIPVIANTIERIDSILTPMSSSGPQSFENGKLFDEWFVGNNLRGNTMDL
jgi:hypothetical protein